MSHNNKQRKLNRSVNGSGRRVAMAIERLEGRTLCSGDLITQLSSSLGAVNNSVDLATLSGDQLHQLNAVTQNAAGLSSMGAAFQIANVGFQYESMLTNVYAFQTGLAVLKADMNTPNLPPETVMVDSINLVSNAMGVAGAGLQIAAYFDPEPQSKGYATILAELLDAGSAVVTGTGIIEQRGAQLQRAINAMCKTDQNALKVTETEYVSKMPGSGQFPAAASALANALTAAVNEATNPKAANAQAVANAANAAATPVNNWTKATGSGVSGATGTMTVGPNNFTLTGGGGTASLSGSYTDTVSGTTETVKATGTGAGTALSLTQESDPNGVSDAMSAGATAGAPEYSVTGRILTDGAAPTETITGKGGTNYVDGASVSLGAGSTAGVVGNGDVITGTGSSTTAQVFGTGNSTDLTGATSTITDNGTGDKDTVTGTGSKVTSVGASNSVNTQGSTESATVSGASSTTSATGASDTTTSTGTGDTVTEGGTGDTTNLQGASETGTATGASDKVNETGASDAANLQGASETATATGATAKVTETGTGDAATLSGSGDSATATGASDQVTETGATDAATLSGTDESVVDSGTSDSVSATGAGDDVTMQGTSETATASGATDAVAATGANDTATIGGTGASLTESGSGDVGYLKGSVEKDDTAGSSETVTATGASDTVTDTGSSDKVNLDGSSETATVTGTSDATYLANTTDTAKTTGSGDTVTGPGAPVITTKISLGGWSTISSYAGVGFVDNTVAVFSATGGTFSASSFSASIAWGDGSTSTGSVAADAAKATGYPFVVLGSHVYKSAGNYPITVTVTGPGGGLASGQVNAGSVGSMPSSASNPATQPAAQGATKPLTYVTLSPGGASTISSYAGVGFQLNTIGVLAGSYDGTADTTPSDYKVQVSWGDSPSWTTGNVVADPAKATEYPMVLLGSHTYATAGNYAIVVDVTGPDGMTVASETCAASVGQMPSGLAGTTPPLESATKAQTYVTLSAGGASTISSYEGIGFQLNTVGVLAGDYDGTPDTTPGDYKVEINWGDSSSWTAGEVVADASRTTSYPMVLLGSHTYTKAGNFPIIVDVTGPDGMATAVETCAASVSPLPNSVTGTTPPVYAGDKAATYVTIEPGGTPTISLTVGQSISNEAIAVLTGDYDGVVDASAGDYHASVNYGDGSGWSTATVVAKPLYGYPLAVLAGSHSFSKVGNYAIVVNITGPDGETVARETCAVSVMA